MILGITLPLSNLSNIRLHIVAGNPYQYIDGVFEVANEQSAGLLQLWADTKGFCELSHDEACGRGFTELADWSKPETDALFCIDDVVLVVQNRLHLQKFNDEIEFTLYG